MAFCADLRTSLQFLNKKMENNDKARRWIDRTNIKETLNELIQFHADAIGFAKSSSLASMDMVSILFLNSVILWCVGLLELQVVSLHFWLLGFYSCFFSR